MNELTKPTPPGLLPVAARRDVSIRVATMDDLPFLDAMQKQHGRALGYFPTKQFEGYIQMGAVLVARASRPCMGETPMPLGYIISRDRYLKRDELGVVYQLCVTPGDQRKLVGATLVREVFNRSAYGCKLYCCWCAQDLPANRFWESMGFVPIAFRAGSTGKRRVHIFWQRRINADDATTPYWYPSATNGGAIRADRLVFPIPPGTHWTEVQAVALPQSEKPTLEGVREKKPSAPRVMQPKGAPTALPRGLRFAPAAPPPAAAKPKRLAERPTVKACPERSRRIDPQLVSKARELRDRYLEQVNGGAFQLESTGRYEVARALPQTHANASRTPLLLPAA